MPKTRAEQRSVDWRPAELHTEYDTLHVTGNSAAASIRKAVEAFHIYADDNVREKFSDRIGKLSSIAEALENVSKDASDSASVIRGTIEAMDAAHKSYSGTRSVGKRAGALRDAEDVRTDYVASMENLFKGVCPVWAARANNGAEQLKRISRTALSQDSAREQSPSHYVSTAQEEVSRTVNTAVGRGDFLQSDVLSESGVKASPLDGMTSAQAQSHRVLAALTRQFRDAGWNTPLSVAVLGNGERTQVVYATVEGVAIWPRDVCLPVNTVPVSYLYSQDIHNILHLYGQVYPVAKLLSCVEDSWEVKALATSDVFDPT